MERREFIGASALASTAHLVPAFLQRFQPERVYSSRSRKILVVIQLSGGNDGLNTIVPYQNDIYYRERPTLSLAPEKVLKVSDELGLNPAMPGMRELFDQGYVSIINSVGYPNPDRSHFRSLDIWHTGSGSTEFWQTGWLGRYLDNYCEGSDVPHDAIEFDEQLCLALKGQAKRGFALDNPDRLRKTAGNPFLKVVARQYAGDNSRSNRDFLYKTLIETQSSARYLYEQSKVHRSKVDYPRHAFGKRLKQIAELITADTDTSIYYVSLSGFDTHANQRQQQQILLRRFSEGVQSLMKDLEQNGLADDVLIMAFSEFGRRVRENGSRGTDHGAANNLFLFGKHLKKGGFYNSGPDLKDLEGGDLKFRIDFRQVYATILEKWLDADPDKILNEKFNSLGII